MTAVIAGLALTLGLSFTSCKKGDTGPAGPAGTNGTNGTNGAANIVNYTVTVNSTDWTLNSTYWYSLYNVSGGIKNNSAVMVYLVGSTGTHVQLPITISDIETYFRFTSTQIEFDVRSASGTTAVSNPGALSFRIVVIPPAMIKPNINIQNYNEVKTAYNLID